MNPLEWALLSRAGKELLRIFHGFRSRHQDIFASQGWLAGKVGCSRMTVWRRLKALISAGFVRLVKRHSHFCVYELLETAQVTPRVTSQGFSPLYLTQRAGRGTPPLKKPPEREEVSREEYARRQRAIAEAWKSPRYRPAAVSMAECWGMELPA